MTNTVITDMDGQPFKLADALLDAPTASLVTDWDNWWSDGEPRYRAERFHGREFTPTKRRGMACAGRSPWEFFTADGSESFAENGRISVVGGGIGGTSAVRWKSD